MMMKTAKINTYKGSYFAYKIHFVYVTFKDHYGNVDISLITFFILPLY